MGVPVGECVSQVGGGEDQGLDWLPEAYGVLDTAAGGRLAEVGEIGAGGTVRLGGEVGDQHFTMHVVPQA